EKYEKLDGDTSLNNFFHDIYKDADEDTRRVESHMTVLSTNWKERLLFYATDWNGFVVKIRCLEKDEKLDGDTSLSNFFHDIYKDADEDTRRVCENPL
nr:hypothetical protein [Tanacetum cinerariifolium]